MLQYWRDIREINKTSGGQCNWEEDKKWSCLEKFENYIIPVKKEGLKSKSLRDWKKTSRTAWSKVWKVISKAGGTFLLTCAGKMSILRFPKNQEWCDVDSPLPLLGRAVFIWNPWIFFLGCHVWPAGSCLCGRDEGWDQDRVWLRARLEQGTKPPNPWMGKDWRERKVEQLLFVGEVSLFLTHTNHPCSKLHVSSAFSPEIAGYLFWRIDGN